MKRMVNMVKVTAAGEVSTVEVPWANGLSELQKHVGGYIEHVTVSDEVGMWVNDEALLEAAPAVNCLASTLYGIHLHRQPICGDVLFFANDPSGHSDYIDDPDLALKVLRMVQVRLKEAMFQ